MTSIVQEGLLPRLRSGPLALTRSGRRITRAALFMIETVSTTRGSEWPLETLPRARRLSWVAENVCALHGIRVVHRGAIPTGPAIFVANHLGYLDPPAIVSLVPAIPIAKRELGDWPLIGDALRGFGVLLVDRNDPHSGAIVLRRALRALSAGASVLAFPEGTTTRGDDVLPFRRGIFGLARRLGVPVVPIAVRYDSSDTCWVGDETFLPHYMRTTARPATRVELAFGAAIPARAHSSAEDLADAAHREVRALLRRAS